MTTQRRRKQKHQQAIRRAMSDQTNPNASDANESGATNPNAADAENPDVNTAAANRAASNKVHVYVDSMVKHNGTWYGKTTVSVDEETAKSLIGTGKARKASEDEIAKYDSTRAARGKSVLDDPRTARMLDLKNSPEIAEKFKSDIEDREPAVDEFGREIPNSLNTDERKLRDDEGNTSTADVPQGGEAKQATKEATKEANKETERRQAL